VNIIEVTRALRQLRVSGMAATLESRIIESQGQGWAPLDVIAALVQDELTRRQDRLLDRREKRAEFRDAGKTLSNFDFDFNKKLDRRLVFELAAGHFIARNEDALFLGPPGTGKSHLAQAIGRAAIQQGHKVLYREAHVLLEELAEATIEGTRKERFAELAAASLLVIDDLGMRKLSASEFVERDMG
jgi:DNA replication protein DnaC